MTRTRALAALVWGAAEAFLLFIVPDVLIGWIALTRGVRAGAIAALLAAAGAAAGGSALWLWSHHAPAAAMAAVEAIPAVSPAMIARAQSDVAREGWFRAALGGPTTGTPFKVYAALAPSAGVGLPAFAAAAVPARLPRFLITAAVFAAVGLALRPRLAPQALILLYPAGWTLFYGWFFWSHPN